MSPKKKSESQAKSASQPAAPAPKAKPAISKPDAMSSETFEFLAAIDEAKRQLMLAHLDLGQVLDVLISLGYGLPNKRSKKTQLTELQASLETYKTKHQRLFPNWSEVFTVARETGFVRAA